MAITKRQLRERPKTFKGVFDEHTEQLLFKLSTEGHFDSLESPISIGKEANIFSAKKGSSRVIVKIYRVENCDFNRMYDYIRTDPRFLNLKQKRRLIIFSWCKREFRNLMKAREAGCSVPVPYAVKDNILVMEFIGNKENAQPAPKLKDFPPIEPKLFFEKIIENMKKMYSAQLVHGDLSSFNILNNDENPVFIDFSQGTLASNSSAEKLLDRDINNITAYFSKLIKNSKNNSSLCDKNKIKEKIKKSKIKIR